MESRSASCKSEFPFLDWKADATNQSLNCFLHKRLFRDICIEAKANARCKRRFLPANMGNGRREKLADLAPAHT
jgi:hypothetical protein